MYDCLRLRNASNRQDNFNAHVLSLMHELAVYEYLIRPDAVAHRVRWIRHRRDLDLAPLLISRHKLSMGCEVLEFFIDALFFDAALPLDKW